MLANNRWAACPTSKWLEELYALSPAGEKVFIDIGCNKGYESARIFNLWATPVGFNAKSLYEAITKAPPSLRRVDAPCGVCRDCQDDVVATHVPPLSSRPIVHCFEPSKAHYRRLVWLQDRFFSTAGQPSLHSQTGARWHLHNAALSNASGTVDFPLACQSERCSVYEGSENRDADRAGVDKVESTTVDAFVAAHNLTRIQLLKIDTEGHDIAVLQGAETTLKSGKVGLLKFEYHGIGEWQKRSLKEVVYWLDKLDFVCYLDGRPTLTRLTGCWEEGLEFKLWSNVVCVVRSHKLYPVMERMSFRWRQEQRAQWQRLEGGEGGAVG